MFAHNLNVKLWAKVRTLSSATTMGQSGPDSNGNEGVLHIPQSSQTGASPSGYLVSYQDTHGGGEGLAPSAEIQLVYSTAQADWILDAV